jgi:Domain of unknown function (DUF4417)
MSTLPPVSTNAAFEPALGCHDCFALQECGGLYRPGGIDCLCYCCNKPDTCTYLCPRNKHFLRVWRDTDGIQIAIKQLHQRPTPLPTYIPLIQHGSKRTTPLKATMVALTTFDVTRRDKRLKDMVRDPDLLRQNFRLATTTPFILSSIAQDPELERYWRERHQRGLIEGIKLTNPTHVIAPNFSLFRDVPRFDNLANIKRSLLCAEEFSTAGLSVIPYVAGITAHDWQRWAAFLREQQEITMVCKEFQTGASTRTKGDWHVHRLEELQQEIGRALHIIAVGGRRYIPALRHFAQFTIIDSNPFMRTMHRRILTTEGWQNAPTLPGAPLDDLLQCNINAYTACVHQLLRGEKLTPRRPIPQADTPTNQLVFAFASNAPSVGSTERTPLSVRDTGVTEVARRKAS